MRILIIANAFNAGITLFVSSVAAFYLPTQEYSRFAYIWIFSNTLASLTDFGFYVSVVKFHSIGKHSNDYLKIAVTIRTIIGFLLIFFAILLPDQIFSVLGFAQHNVIDGRLAMIGSSFIGIWLITRICHQAEQNWNRMALTTSLFGALRVIGVSTAIYLDSGLALFVVASIIIPAIFSSAASTKFLSFKKPTITLETKKKALNLWNYGKWVALGTVFFQLYFSCSSWYASKFLNSDEASKLFLSLSLAGAAGLVVTTLRSILLTHITRIECQKDWDKYLVTARKQIIYLLLTSTPTIFAVAAITEYFFAEKYMGIFGMITLTCYGIVVTGGIGYYSALIHAVNRPQEETILSFVKLTCLAFLLSICRPETASGTIVSFICVGIAGELFQVYRAFRIKSQVPIGPII